MALGGRKSLLVVAAAVAVFVLVLPAALAAAQATQQGNPERKFRTGDSVTVPAGETVPHDLYAFAGNVTINGRVEGDLIAAGGQIDITGPVTGDVIAGGGNVRVSGPVDGDVRVGAGNVDIAGQIREDLLVGAGSLVVGSGAQIGQDLIFGTGQTTMSGTVGGSVLGSTSSYNKTGTVRGTERVDISEPREAERREPSVASSILDFIRRYIAVVLAGALMLWLTPALFRGAATLIRERPLPSLGWGVVGAIGFFGILLALFIAMLALAIPLGILGFGGLTAVTVFGAILSGSVLTFAFLIIAFYVALALVGFMIGRWILGLIGQPTLNRAIWALLLGVLIVLLLTVIPVVGGLIHLILFLFGLGGLVLFVLRRRSPEPGAAAVA